MNLIENGMIESAIQPQDITGAGANGDWITLKDYAHVTIVLVQGVWAAATPAVTLQQATDAAGTGAKSIPVSTRWQKAIGEALYTKLAVVGDTFNLPNAAHTIHVLEIDAAALDTTSGFVWLRVRVATPGVASDFLEGIYILTLPDSRQIILPSGKG